VADIKSEYMAGLKSESVAGFELECMADFIGIRIWVRDPEFRPVLRPSRPASSVILL
jgi:hypothetical protein